MKTAAYCRVSQKLGAQGLGFRVLGLWGPFSGARLVRIHIFLGQYACPPAFGISLLKINKKIIPAMKSQIGKSMDKQRGTLWKAQY